LAIAGLVLVILPGKFRSGGIKRLFDFRTNLAGLLMAAVKRLEQRPRNETAPSRFVDLAPTDNADERGVYTAALTDATDKPRVRNIALTGPYGSGKSSIIQSFLKSYPGDVLQISLAAFLPEANATPPEPNATDVKVSRQEIERSILQQMLYGADANRLPLSRFKRIQSPGRWSKLVSLFITLGIIACWHLIDKRETIVSGAFFIPLDRTNWLNFLSLGIGGLFLWLVFHQIYIASFGISLKSISLKDIEITPKAATEESILNRHLDEIIYFFQSTKYDLVVIEDLDRFNSPDIFVTLREINSLINANEGVRRPVRFLYALRDDMFGNTDRTKFFEFIIPVIPIINSSNSIDKMLEHGARLSLNSRLNPQFLREVSRYLNDLRLIQNIFNEYAIYVDNLETGDENNLDANKLLAILIYKNVFPSDFELLHREMGNLAEVLRSHDRYVAASEARCKEEIARLEWIIDASDKQLPRDLHELRSIYAMAIVETLPEWATRLSTDRSNVVHVNALANADQLEAMLATGQFFYTHPNGHWQNASLKGLMERVDPDKTFAERAEDIQRKSASSRDDTQRKLHALRTKMGSLRMMKFDELIRENSDDLDDLFARFGDREELARFLILEGYLDDTYYQYTSLFHSGRLSPSDNKFLIRIRAFSNPEPDFQIDNPSEVIVAMRDEDFSRNYVLNVKIVDTLLTDPTTYAVPLSQLIEFIASNFGESEVFLATYYDRGADVGGLLKRLATAWPGFVAAVIDSRANLVHVGNLISRLTHSELAALAEKNPTLSSFVSERLPNILVQGADFPAERLQLLDIEVTNLRAVADYPGFLRTLFESGLYVLSIENLEVIFSQSLGVHDDAKLHERNYTTVLEAQSAPLSDKVNSQFSEYLEKVLLGLPNNRCESIAAITEILGRGDVELDMLVRFLERQSASLPSLEQIPETLHAVVFRTGRIDPTWENCLSFIGSAGYDAAVLTEFLNRSTTRAALTGYTVPGGESAAPLRQFIVGNDGLSDAAYAEYVKALPRRFKAFPSPLSAEKTRLLVRQDSIEFSPSSLAHLAEDIPTQVEFLVNNKGDFFASQDDYDLDDDFREKLVAADLTDEDRLKIIGAMDLSTLAGLQSRAAIVGSVIARTGLKIDNLGNDGARELIIQSRPFVVQVRLFNMLHKNFDDEQVRSILLSLPKPLSDIGPGWATPKLEDNEVNVAFATWLKERGFISSWSKGGLFDNDIRLHMFRK